MPAVEPSHVLMAAPGETGLVIEKHARSPAEVRALAQEYALLQRLPPELFATPLDYASEGHTALLRCRIPYTQRLDQRLEGSRKDTRGDTRPMAAPAALALCLSLARIVAVLHEAGQADRALVPQRFYVPPGDETGRACLAELGRPTRPSVEERDAGAVAWLDGDLDYMAPEQTGRMNRSIDHRADLYTLGVIFYRLLVGRLPFSGADDLALVHAHLSSPPPSPSAFIAGFEPAWEAMLHKLLAKNAEDRYQTADGLVHDLKALLAHARAGTRADGFVAGAEDLSAELSIPARLYGRATERQTVLDSFATALAGGKALLLVAGSSGTGKSSLINEVHKPITAARGTFVAGKFDQFQRDQPYIAVLGALRDLVRLLLAERESVVTRWRERLNEALVGEGRVMTDLLPEVLHLIGPQPALPEIEPAEAAARMKRVFQHFFRVLARPEHPLVLFLDDLQWADAASLQLIETLFCDPRAGHLMVLGAYRDNEITPGHLLPGVLSRIAEAGTPSRVVTIGALAVETVAQLLADTLHRGSGEVAELAALLHQKTAGNPFHLKVLLHSLAERGVVRPDPMHQRWLWDEAVLENEAVSGNVVDLLLASMRQLPSAPADVLSLAAFLGATFSHADLLDVSHRQVEQLDAELELLERQRYLLRLHGDGPMRLRFQHDRVQEAAYLLCPPARRRTRHVRIGRRLAQREPELAQSPRLFAILQHLNHALPVRPGQRFLPLLRLNLAAGMRARRSLAYDSAVQWLGLVHQRLDEALWQADRPFAFSVSFELANALYLDGQTARAEQVVLALLPHAEGALEIGTVQDLHLTLLCVQARYDEAIEVGRAALAALGIELPIDNLENECVTQQSQVDSLLLEVPPDRLIGHRLMTDPSKRLALRIMKSLHAPASLTQPMLCQFARRLAMAFTLQHGLAPETGYVVASYALTSPLARHDEAGGARLGHIGLALAEKFGGQSDVCTVCEAIVGHLNHWLHPLADSALLTQRAFAAGIASGETQFVAYAYLYQGFNLFHGGTPLPRLIELTSDYRKFSQSCGNRLAVDSLDAVQLLAMMLGSETPPVAGGNPASLMQLESGLLAEWQERASTNALLPYHVGRAQIHLLFGELEAAAALVAHVRVEGLTLRLPGVISIAVHHFIETLLIARLAPGDAAGREAALARIEANLLDLRRWAAASPGNFGHCVPAAEAELALLHGRADEALRLLQQALDLAESGRMVLDQILLAERAAELCYLAGRTAAAAGHVLKAFRAAQALQASRKIDDLLQRHPWLAASAPEPARAAEAGALGRSLQQLEFERLLDIIGAFSREIGLEALVTQLAGSLLELSGASGFALLLLDEAGEWRVRARMGLGNGALVFEDRPFEAQAEGSEAEWLLPHRPIRLGLNSAEIQVADRPAELPQFDRDAYLMQRRPGAIVCMPVAVGGETVGLIYLESALASGVFSAKALRGVEILSGQIGISLLNASLYERMERQVAQRTAALRSANESLEELAQTLQTLGDVGQEITSQLALRDVLPTLARHAGALVRDAEPAIFRTRADASLSLHGEALDGAVPSRDTLAADAGLAALAAEAARQSRELAGPDGGSLALPLVVGQRRVGVLAVRRSGRDAFDARERLILRTLASYGAIALDNAAAYDDLDRALKRLHETQAQLVVTEKLAALGQLTAGVAHEIQNPLNFVNNFADVSKELVDELRVLAGTDAAGVELCRLIHDNLDTILANGRRMSAIVRGMLRHSQSRGGDPTATDLNALLRARVAVLDRSLPIERLAPLLRQVRFDWFLAGDLPLVYLVAPDVADVIDNLLHNALAALDAQRLDSAAAGRSFTPVLGLTTRQEAASLLFTLRDNGSGIALDLQPRLFTPFFTTRAPGEGSGLGLSLGYDVIVKRHGGALEIRSVPGEGTEVLMRLPLNRAPAAAPPRRSAVALA